MKDITLKHRRAGFALDAEFALAGARVTALFGPSGAGKSTIIAAIAGLIRPEFGRITIAGECVFDSQSGIFVQPRARRIGVMFQDLRLFPHLSVEDNLFYGWRRAQSRPARGAADEVVELLGLSQLLKRKPQALSGGERSRVALGRALLMGPRALLLDEPLASLDAARKAEILPYFEKIVRETRIPMLYVSHALDEIARLADHMVLLDHGRVVAEGPVFELTARLDLFSGSQLIPGTVLPATVLRHDEVHGLTEIGVGAELLVVPRVMQNPGNDIRIRIDAEDVMLSLTRLEAVSANNVLPATIADIRKNGPHADVQLQVAGARLVARITRRSLQRLDLSPGLPVFAVIKSVTVGGREG
ncbi:MAG TPA: molybdenum ABC transporter ATP-binding protein [Micropepsaceae bacterium]|nr:molybdenum ABC transporter ATP-binding protein [Micropepsaceae bacterium]